MEGGGAKEEGFIFGVVRVENALSMPSQKRLMQIHRQATLATAVPYSAQIDLESFGALHRHPWMTITGPTASLLLVGRRHASLLDLSSSYISGCY